MGSQTEKEDEDTRETWRSFGSRWIQSIVYRKEKRRRYKHVTRPVIIQIVPRTDRDEVWKKSREARVCKEMNISSKKTFQRKIAKLVLSCGQKCKKPGTMGREPF
ncbi:1,4-alpha-glucan branching enzyme GlgB [Labeo rohita]|uniref:1,4-alpha-glucan branching enzyme GlgB n=1 Tax=Labeo rohita TaxID=84645 RepID=A0ABQ8L671_LABRO|nr:1,4-alpha-glucan branching enzyme GlgB [Labeo rohita]